MVSNDKFFSASEKQSAAVLKHEILRGYLGTFAAKTGSTSLGHRVAYIDGYAGPGTYTNPRTGGVIDGSPKIALRVAEGMPQQGKTLECVFIEKNDDYFDDLSALVASSKTPARALHGDVSKLLSQAMEPFKAIPKLIFLDPFGTSLSNEMAVDTVMKKNDQAPTELLLNFSLEALRRMGGRIIEEPEKPGRAKTLARVDDWVGGQWWREYFLDPESRLDPDHIDHAAQLVADEYSRRLKEATGCSVFRLPIRRRAHHKALFSLMLFFPRNLAAFAFNESVSLALEKWRGLMNEIDINEAAAAEDRGDFALGDPSVAEMQEVFKLQEKQFELDTISDIEHALRTALVENDSLSTEKDLSLIMGAALGSGRTKHLRAAWKKLHADGIVSNPPPAKLDRQVIRRA